ncbi:MAG: heme exporter protein CcmD [Burkholderiales bacterium]|nr:heme exporter protein CcmD [Burkholderiales bacterium]MBH2014947.1 heme exporter protein CcmD [Burkholderiales bacterium]
MNWGSWHQFADMGGHGLYVWGSFGVVALSLVWEAGALAWRHRLALRCAGDPA